eukprot:TRINITY_DN13002_c1_g1_i1.p1 TRINITY_DN13002_c1_g1~~TRINITY_DN13002_c1_g1_i1.p1  ORF type:complete len:899 (-),score=91.01 TRINITY_DN13002_c1_g1_i1:34-2730(-)
MGSGAGKQKNDDSASNEAALRAELEKKNAEIERMKADALKAELESKNAEMERMKAEMERMRSSPDPNAVASGSGNAASSEPQAAPAASTSAAMEPQAAQTPGSQNHASATPLQEGQLRVTLAGSNDVNGIYNNSPPGVKSWHHETDNEMRFWFCKSAPGHGPHGMWFMGAPSRNDGNPTYMARCQNEQEESSHFPCLFGWFSNSALGKEPLPQLEYPANAVINVPPAPSVAPVSNPGAPASQGQGKKCMSPGCNYKVTWHETHCCNACKGHGAAAHGPHCGKVPFAVGAAAPSPAPTSQGQGKKCMTPGCEFEVTWHATHCCNGCKGHGAHCHGPRCDKKQCTSRKDPAAVAVAEELTTDVTLEGEQILPVFPTCVGRPWKVGGHWSDPHKGVLVSGDGDDGHDGDGNQANGLGAGDMQHPQALLRSREFVLTPNLKITLIAKGGQGGKESVSGQKASVSGLSEPTGFMGVALRLVSADTWIASKRKQKGECDQKGEVLQFTCADFKTSVGQRATLDLIDAYHGQNGWIRFGDIQFEGLKQGKVAPAQPEPATMAVQRVIESHTIGPDGKVTAPYIQFFRKYGFICVSGHVDAKILQAAQDHAKSMVLADLNTKKDSKMNLFGGLPEGVRPSWADCREPELRGMYDSPLAKQLFEAMMQSKINFATHLGTGALTFASRWKANKVTYDPAFWKPTQQQLDKLPKPLTLDSCDKDPWTQDFIRDAARLGMEVASCPHPNWHIDGQSSGQVAPHSFDLLIGTYINGLPRGGMGNLILYPGSHVVAHDLMKEKGAKHGLGYHNAARGEKRVPADVNFASPNKSNGKAYFACVKPGDFVIAHPFLAHGISQNECDQPRFALYVRAHCNQHGKNHSKLVPDKSKDHQGPQAVTGDLFSCQPGCK